MRIKQCSVAFAILISTVLPVRAESLSQETIFTYDYEGAQIDYYGIQRLVRTDVAMLLKEPGLVGKKIKGVSIDVPSKEGCSCDPTATAWLTSKLEVSGEDYVADIADVTGKIVNYGTADNPQLQLNVTFDTPYTLTDRGVYVGYSLTVTSCKTASGWTSKYPIVTVRDIDREKCFMIHTNKGQSTLPQKYPEWTDLGENLHQALAMRVILEGESSADAVMLEPQQTLYVAAGGEGPVYCNLSNCGETPVTSIEYTYTIDGRSYTKELALETPVEGKVGAYTTLDLIFEAPAEQGVFSVPVTVTKVNGHDNGYRGEPGVLQIESLPFLPVYRPAIEDYTGMWCGYCPEVYVLCHQMADKYGSDFISLAYHVNDELQSVSAGHLASESYGLPLVYMVDRNKPMEYANMEYLWLRERRRLAPADIDLRLYWNDEAHTELRVESDVRFVYGRSDASYMIAYALVEDGMSSPGFRQRNYFYNKVMTGPYWDLFSMTSYNVTGIVYDEVVVDFPDTRGIMGSLPDEISSGEVYSHSAILRLADATCKYSSSESYGKNIILDSDKLRVVTLLIDGETGNVCNSATTGYSAGADLYGGSSSVSLPDAGDTSGCVNAEVEYYSIDGRRLHGIPEKGIYIKVCRHADGSCHVTSSLVNR